MQLSINKAGGYSMNEKDLELLNKIETIEHLDDESNYVWYLKTMNIDKMWEHTKGEGVKIALIDTGVNIGHPDIEDKIKGRINMFEKSLDVTDESGHGSAVAGLLVGEKTGVAPNAELYVAKVLNNDGRGNMTSIMDGITFAINHNVDVLCMSLGTTKDLPIMLKERIAQAYQKGTTIVCAAGNSGVNDVQSPAKLDEVIGVGGLNENLEQASFSNHGNGLDFVAPAVNIVSTNKENNYVKMTGTSMASPLIAGVIALIISLYRKEGIELHPNEVKEILKNHSPNEKWNTYTGWGMPNLENI